MINLKIYKYKLVNLNKVNMTKETKKQVSPIEQANSNVNLKTHLTLALKNTSIEMSQKKELVKAKFYYQET